MSSIDRPNSTTPLHASASPRLLALHFHHVGLELERETLLRSGSHLALASVNHRLLYVENAIAQEEATDAGS